MNPPPVPSPDAEHLRVLSICHYITAGLTLLMSCFIPLHYAIMKMVFTSPEMMRTKPGQPAMPFDPAAFFALFQWFYVIAALFMLAAVILTAMSGRYIQRRVNRLFSLIVAGFLCMFFPFGTALGVFTFIVLTRESVRRLYFETESQP
ncbi:MAG: hypothetical protein RIS79_868 [Verrucomicrobiota bacterium]